MIKLYLHIGLAKTGTTSTQLWFKNNQKTLAKEKILYPDDFLHDGAAHHKLPMLIKEKKIDLIVDSLEKIVIAAKSRGAEKILLSSEEFSTLSKEEIALLSDITKKLFSVVFVVISVRPHFSLFQGSYYQQVREGFISCSMSEFWLLARRHARFLQLGEIIKNWELVASDTGDVVFLNAEKGFETSGDALKNIRQFLGLDARVGQKVLSEKMRHNVSLSSAQTQALLELKRQRADLWHESISWDKRRFCYLAFQKYSQSFNRLSKEESTEIISSMVISAESCRDYYSQDWELAGKSSEFNVLPSASHVYQWYEAKVEELEGKFKRSFGKEREPLVLDDNDNHILDASLAFYGDFPGLSSYGPSVQLKFFEQYYSG